MIVVDTNILIYLFIEGEYTDIVEKLLDYDCNWAVPILWRSEFNNVLAMYLRKKIISLRKAIDLSDQAAELVGENEYQPISEDVLELVNSSTCSAYDCEFVSVARQLRIPLATHDKKILTEFPRYAFRPEVLLAK